MLQNILMKYKNLTNCCILYLLTYYLIIIKTRIKTINFSLVKFIPLFFYFFLNKRVLYQLAGYFDL